MDKFSQQSTGGGVYLPLIFIPGIVMKRTCNRLYESMQEELKMCMEQSLPPLAEIENCHQIVLDYWHLLREKLCTYSFPNAEEEVCFFKEWKPRFVSEIIFYELLNHIELFKPENSASYRNLLLREKRRLEKFVWNNGDFVEYYKSGETSKDEIYFVRNKNEGNAIEISPYDLNEKTSTAHDYQVAQIIALERYDQFLDKKLKELETKNEEGNE